MLKYVFVGCGRIAHKHAEILTAGQAKSSVLVGVCDIDQAKAKAFGEKYKVPYFTDMHQMMKEIGSGVDVISILTESGNHAKHCLDLVQYRKHFVVEKPMALTLSDADKMIEMCDRAGVKLFVVKQNRYNLPVQKLRRALEADRFGKLVMGTVRVRWARDQKYYDQAPWRGTWSLDGGVFSNQASHHVDLLVWMMGEPVSVYARSTRALANIEAEDTGVAIVKFKSGALGVIEATTATRPKDLEGSLSVLGEKGSVEISGFAVNQMRHWNFVESANEDGEVVENFRENPPNVYGFGHVAYLNHVAACILDGKSSLVDGLEGRKSLELISAIYESIATEREVHLRYNAEKCPLGRPSGVETERKW